MLLATLCPSLFGPIAWSSSTITQITLYGCSLGSSLAPWLAGQTFNKGWGWNWGSWCLWRSISQFLWELKNKWAWLRDKVAGHREGREVSMWHILRQISHSSPHLSGRCTHVQVHTHTHMHAHTQRPDFLLCHCRACNATEKAQSPWSTP